MKKIRCDHVPELSIFDLRKWHLLERDCVFDVRWSGVFGLVDVKAWGRLSAPDQHIEVTYGEGQDFKRYPIQLTRTKPLYGGQRYWFNCPLTINGVLCARRVGKLYLVDGYFGCRHCHDLTYASQQISRAGLRGFVFYHMARYRRLIDKYESLRTKFFKGRLTKRHAQYAKKQQELDQLLGLSSQDTE